MRRKPSIVWLAGVVIASVESIALGRKFPEAYSIDTTQGTNKALAAIVGVDGNLKSFSAAHAFLDGETVESFKFLMAALEKLLGSEWLKSIHVISTDGDGSLMEAIDSLQLLSSSRSISSHLPTVLDRVQAQWR